MIVEQIKLPKMDTFCYIIEDENSKTCALIDPAFDTKRILDKVNELGVTVTHVINTHGHSDHTAGNAAIISVTNAKLFIHKEDAVNMNKFLSRTFSRLLGGKGSPKPDVLLEDNQRIKIGDTVLKVIHTPGHTPGSICLYIRGHLFTGDTLFVGSMGRTDLSGGSAEQILSSIHEKIYTLPGDTLIWPGHDYGSAPHSTVENEEETNPYTVRSGINLA